MRWRSVRKFRTESDAETIELGRRLARELPPRGVALLIGNLGADPEIRRTQDGRPVANLRIATSENWRDKATGERRERISERSYRIPLSIVNIPAGTIIVSPLPDAVDVRLVVDAGAAVDAVVQRTGARAFVRGSGDDKKYTCNVEYVQRTDEVEVGDLLVTSGVGRRFPKGIPIGIVTQVLKRDFGIYQQVVAAPTVDFSRLEEVLILVTGVPDEPHASKDAPAGTPKK